MCVLLEIVQKLLDKLKISSMINQEWHAVISSTLSPQLINLANSGTDLPLQIGQVAATIVSIDGQKYSGLVEQLTADGVGIEIVEQFLRRLLEKSDIHQITTHQNVLIQVLMKSSTKSFVIYFFIQGVDQALFANGEPTEFVRRYSVNYAVAAME